MAGVGFELRKAVTGSRHGDRIKGYLGAAFSSSGSVIVGIVLFTLVQLAAKAQQLPREVSDQFMCYVTNAMFLSMMVTSVFSLVLSRYVSNAIYMQKPEKIMPSLSGGIALVTVLGGSVFAVQISLSGIELYTAIPLMLLFLALNACWLLMTYITLLRSYLRVVVAYAVAFAASIIMLLVLCAFTTLSIPTMILVLTLGFSVVDVVLFRALYLTFSKQEGSPFAFLSELWHNKSLAAVGFLMMLGMLGHFWVMWFFDGSSAAVGTLFRFNAKYDFPAIVAYFSTIPSAVYFITLFDTGFSEAYQQYFWVLGNGGDVKTTEAAKEVMISVLRKGLRGIAAIQMISCILFVTVGSKVLSVMNIGMTEGMLGAFRMFCAGYSLYYIGNTLILLQLYFTNEKHAAWTALLFAAGVTGGTYAAVRLLPTANGVAFTIAGAVMTLIAGVQLTRYLSDLEYNTLCRSNYRGGVPLDKRSNRPKHPKRMTRMTAAAVLVLIIVIGSASWMVRDYIIESQILTFTPKASDAVLLSPGMGLAPWAESEETAHLKTSLVYVELSWANWEPEDDAFDAEYVREHYHLEQYRDEGRQVVFRFICDNPTEAEHTDIPQWLFDMTGDGDFYNNDYGKGYSPNYENQAFIAEHAEAVAAFGEAFGQDNFFCYVELGSLGHWGEWHVKYESGIRRMPPFEVRDQYLQPYFKAFPHAKFLLRYPLIDAQQYRMGLYNDLSGDFDETLYWMNQMTDGKWEQTELDEQADCKDAWKTMPVGGEFGQTHDNDYFMKTEFDMTLESLRMSHQSFIGPKIIVDESDEKYSYQMNEILKTIGYRLRVSEVKASFFDSEIFTISCTMQNDGIAPVYTPYSVSLSLYNAEGTAVWTSESIDFDVRKVLPNEPKTFSVTVNKDEVDDDAEYTLGISLNSEQGAAAVPMAMEKQIETNVYAIAAFTVK